MHIVFIANKTVAIIENNIPDDGLPISRNVE